MFVSKTQETRPGAQNAETYQMVLEELDPNNLLDSCQLWILF